ncbi:MAG: class I SAM-dependent methyltransferase [Bacteroidales bacterium]|jgi:ubiquinone/menaquinone biosynthesis C-methylase UbiE|nr:class I SAM-dependent methyltransferase [Bacteroidales bacterium]
MRSIEESVVIAMDGSDKELFPFLPYILQDLWEIGADPDIIIKLIRKNFNIHTGLRVLDLGCGKGAVSVKVSKALGCMCYGIDALPEFIDYARRKAVELNVQGLCKFKTGDIRKEIKNLTDYDILILGAIGPVFGDYYKTLTTLSGCIKKNGVFIIDDGYIEDDTSYTHPFMFKKNTIMQQIEKAGMEVVEHIIMNKEEIKESDDHIFENLSKRCYELMKKYPDKQNLFHDYIKKQKTENYILENLVTGTTMVLKKTNH